jgi:hypothetical protein
MPEPHPDDCSCADCSLLVTKVEEKVDAHRPEPGDIGRYDDDDEPFIIVRIGKDGRVVVKSQDGEESRTAFECFHVVDSTTLDGDVVISLRRHFGVKTCWEWLLEPSL